MRAGCYAIPAIDFDRGWIVIVKCPTNYLPSLGECPPPLSIEEFKQFSKDNLVLAWNGLNVTAVRTDKPDKQKKDDPIRTANSFKLSDMWEVLDHHHAGRWGESNHLFQAVKCVRLEAKQTAREKKALSAAEFKQRLIDQFGLFFRSITTFDDGIIPSYYRFHQNALYLISTKEKTNTNCYRVDLLAPAIFKDRRPPEKGLGGLVGATQ